MKSIQQSLKDLRSIQHLAVPIDRGLSELIAATATQTPTRWLVPCSHTFFPSATENELEALRAGLRQDIPFPLVELLQITNGAELFRIHYLTSKNGYWIPRYEVLSCARLLKVNRELLEIFESYAEFDENYHEELESLKLDYLAFCDVGDGNHLALHLTPSPVQPVFYLDHDYGTYPYSDRSAREGYPLIANSLPEWLELLIRTDGRDGLGGVFIPL